MSIHIPSSNGEPVEPAIKTALPETLPILPLRDSVPFPETLTPLAIGQERSIALINDVLAGDRMLAMVASRDPEVEEPGPEDLYASRRRRRGGSDAQGSRRHPPHPRPRRPTGRPEGVHLHPALFGRADRGGPGHSHAVRAARGSPPQRAEHFLADHRGGALPARGTAGGCGESRRSRGARAHDRGRAADQDRREAGAARGARRDEAAAHALRAARARARARRDRDQDPDPGPVGDGEGPARVVPAPADEGDPGGARRVRRAGARGAGAPPAARRGGPARGSPEAGRARARTLRATASAGRRARRDPHVPRMACVAALVEVDDGQPRPEARARGARPRPLRHRGGQGPHPRVPRRAQAQARRPLLDPVLRRPARRGQDITRQVDRRRHGAGVRAHLGWVACATSRRSAATGAPTSAPCRERSCARCATRARTTRSS